MLFSNKVSVTKKDLILFFFYDKNRQNTFGKCFLKTPPPRTHPTSEEQGHTGPGVHVPGGTPLSVL